ncbi:PREDICTED: COMM domain-containing protein 2 [Nicrophorus vespilloides]|uniref:COMM domain-containing protein 2 n=1 Tax=Nicrophorus vespilloides TaxID=110193 RepID=A0ABM1MU95_NICVS|nr:PREDICTED: COMM domain-containing protein 2 [Nicrophorus vespilloides]
MLLSFRNDHKEHLNLLTKHSVDDIVYFCKLAIGFINNGPNNMMYNRTATNLNIEFHTVQNCIYGLINLLILACRHKLNEADFRDSILTIGFSCDQQNVLYEFYRSKSEEISEILKKQLIKDPYTYYNLDWRFEIQVSSRSLLDQVIPLITMDLVLKDKEKADELKHVFLEADPRNVMHITEELEKALAESKYRHLSRVPRTFIE